MKRSIRLVLFVPTVAVLMAASCYLGFKAIEWSLIEENEMLVHSVAQTLMPALLAGDFQQVESLLKSLESHPGIQSAELISGQGIPLASYSREGGGAESAQAQFALASQEDAMDLHVVAPLTFDTQILANLHIAFNLWPAYLRIIEWLGVLLIIPSVLFVAITQMRIKVRFERAFDAGGGSGSNKEFNLDQVLEASLKESDISLEYQPIKRLSDDGIFGAEIVVCWKHPSGQTLYVSPSDFISLSERSGFFLPLSNWVLETACQQFSAWQQQHGPLVLAMNITPSQLKDLGFYQKVREVCEASQFPHQLIEFEIDEAVLLRSKTALADIDVFVQRGLNLAVDSFGLSASSHNLLQNSSIQKVKFAACLIRNVVRDAEMSCHVQYFARLALAHDVQMMADGLDSLDQAVVMGKMGCILGQGVHTGQALSASKFAELLASQPRHGRSASHGSYNTLAGVSLGY